MNEEDGQLDKFLYGEEFSNVEEVKVAAENGNGEEEEFEDEEEEDDYEIILDSSKLPAGNASGTTDLNKRSLTSVAIGEGKGDEANEGGTGADSSNPSGASSSGPVSHFDPFAPGNLNGLQIYDHDLETFEDKPWRKPGADLTDYFNFGFNEVTWRAYCVKQKALREEFGLQKKIGVYDSGAAGNISSSSVNTTGSSGYANNNTNQAYNSSYQSRPRRPPPPSSQTAYQNYNHQQGHDQRYPSYSRNDQGQGGYQGRGDQAPQAGYQGRSDQSQQGGYQNRNDSAQQGGYQGRPDQGQQGGYQGRSEYSRPPSAPMHHASRTRSRHEDSQSPPPPPPPPASAAHSSRYEDRCGSRSRSRSPESARTTRYVSTGRTRYDDSPRSPPNKRRRD